MHRMIVMGSDVTRTYFGVIMHLSVRASHLLLHNDVRISMKALNHVRGVLLIVLKGFAISTVQILLVDSPLIIYLFAQLVLGEL